ncbi:hypothetical protein HPB48_001692 [Haemaphysalis longicornis]|uniref:Cytochrome P450 n=1 Tax=Haemaphysalis longicornis TaxID=44386 RepID=A0A9J6FT11_HAELO|nr:hypothetical protein HPB48_001692 [Haemaphysalis longicornis]
MVTRRFFIIIRDRFVTRSCDKDYMHNNVTIPAGTSILVPVHHLGRDPDFWDEPDKFDPDR